MKRQYWVRFWVITVSVFVCMGAAPMAQEIAQGLVFHDRNGNGVLDNGEEGIAGVRVSNGLEVVVTDAAGRYELPVDDDTIIFVLKPRDWMTPVDEYQLPQFFYIHKPEGSPPDLQYAGVEPTGPLPESIDYPLVRQDEPESFKTIVFGDTQPGSMREIEYIAYDVVADIIGTDAAFGVTLGDISGNNLDLFEPLSKVIGQIGIPWFNVIGNHDLNQDIPDARWSTETFQRVFGPPYYAFEYGPVHFISISNNWWLGDRYIARMGEDQVDFVLNVLDTIDRDQLVVLMAHIPFQGTEDRDAIYKALSEFPNRLVLAGHVHHLEHYFVGEESGWTDEEPLHVIVPGMVCGNWWSGHHDEYGIPHATMYDGAPNGHSLFTFDGSDYSFEYIPARRPRDFQMAIYAPDAVAQDEASETEILVNVFAGSVRNVVEMRLREGDEWAPMEHVAIPDPNYVRLMREAREIRATLDEHGVPLPGVLGYYGDWIPDSRISPHMWRGMLPSSLSEGTYTIHVRSTDMFGQVHEGRRIIRVE